MKGSFFKLLVCLSMALPFASLSKAQGPSASITFSIEGLTNEMRDGLMRELRSNADLRLAFACVPAGILVFEGYTTDTDRLRERLAPIMEHRIARQRIRTIDASRSTVEQQCAEARNR